MTAARDDGEDARAERELRFCCLFKESVTMSSKNKQTRAVCTKNYRETATRYEPCTKCRAEIDSTLRYCGNPFGEHRSTYFRRKLKRVEGSLTDFSRYPAFRTCTFVCAYCIHRANRDWRRRRQNRCILKLNKHKIKEQLQAMGLCKDDVRKGIIQIMKKSYVVLPKIDMNQVWENKNSFSIKNIPEVENFDSSDNNDQRSLCLYDADEEMDDCEEYSLQVDQYSESSFSDFSLTENRLGSNSKNFNSDLSDSLQDNFNIKQNLFTSTVLKKNASECSRGKIKQFKKRHSLFSDVAEQYKCAKRFRSHSDDSPKKMKTTSSLKLTLKRDHFNQGYFISSQSSIQLTEPKNSLEIVDVNSEDGPSSNFISSPSNSEYKTSVTKDSDPIESTFKLSVNEEKTVPELEINDTRPVNIPVNRDNLENSLSSFLKSKLKRNLKDTIEVGNKRQKLTDDPVALNINVNITVNSVVEESLQKKLPLELKSSNDDSQVHLPKTNICSTSDFSSCYESEDESCVSNLNSKNSMPKKSYLRTLACQRNTGQVRSTQKILQVNHNLNIQNKVHKVNKIALENCENNEIKRKIKVKKNLAVNGLKLVFKNLFGDVSDSSEAEDEIFKKYHLKTNGIAQSVEKNQSKNEADIPCTANQGENDMNKHSLKSTAFQNIGVNDVETETNKESLDINVNSEIYSIGTNDQSVNLPENQTLISCIKTDKHDGLNEIFSDKNIPEQIDESEKYNGNEKAHSYIVNNNNEEHIDELQKSHSNEETNFLVADNNIPKQSDELQKCHSGDETKSLITNNNIPKQTDELQKNIPKQIDELQKSHSSEEINTNIEDNISKQVDEHQKSHNIEETNSYTADNFSSKDQVTPDVSQTDDQMDLEGGDFEFISSINKNRTDNEYSDDEYNDSDCYIEYEDHRNIEYDSDVELIENSNKNLQSITDEKSNIKNRLEYKQEIFAQDDTHNLNQLPSFYNEDVKNFVNKDIVDVNDDDILILNDLAPFSKAENKNNTKVDKKIKSETVIDLESDEETVTETSEYVIFEESNNELTNREVNNSKDSITNGTSNNLYTESDSEIYQSTESNDNNVEINNAIKDTEVNDIHLSELALGEQTLNKPESIVTLTYEENGSVKQITIDANKPSVSPNAKVRVTSEVTVGSNKTSSINTYIDNLIKNALKTSSNPNEMSAQPSTPVKDISNNILVSNSENSSNALIADDSEDNLDLNRKSISPNALVIDETAGNDDSKFLEVNKSIFNETISTDNEVTSSIDELNAKRAIPFTGNLSSDLNNPSILQEFNLSRENIAPEEIKSEPGMPVDSNNESEICGNLLEEIQRNTSTSNNEVPSSVVVEVRPVENLLKDINVNVDNAVDDLNEKELKTTGPLKCRDINELLKNPTNKKVGSNDTGISNETVQITKPSVMPSSITDSSNSTTNMVYIQSNNSANQQINQNNLMVGNNLMQTNGPNPICISLNQMQNMVNVLYPYQTSTPQQPQAVLNAGNPLVVTSCTQPALILNQVQNNQMLPQGFTSTSSNVQNQTGQFVYASMMFPNLFAPKITLLSNLSEPQVPRVNLNIPSAAPMAPSNLLEPQQSRLNANIPSVVPIQSVCSVCSLPFRLFTDFILPEPYTFTHQETAMSAGIKIIKFRKIVLNKIETELNLLRKLSKNTILTYIDAFISKKTLTENIWNFHVAVLNIMKCIHAILKTTSKKEVKPILDAIVNSLKLSEIPRMEGALSIFNVCTINSNLQEFGYQLYNTDECINPVPEELEKLQDPSQLRQMSNPMSAYQKEMLRNQIAKYKDIEKMHKIQTNLRNLNCTVGSLQVSNVNQNSSVTIRPINVPIIVNKSTEHNSLQKLSVTKKQQSFLSTSNSSIEKNIDKARTNNSKTCTTRDGSEKKEATSESILDNLNTTCLRCEKTSEITCSNCLSVAYCSQECQYNHWEEDHHKTCEKHPTGIKFL